MVAGGKRTSTMMGTTRDAREIPALDSEDIEQTIEAFTFYLMRNKQAHLGLKPKETSPVRGTFALGEDGDDLFKDEMNEYNERIEIWEKRKSEAMAYLYEACACDADIQIEKKVYIKTCLNSAKECDPAELIDILLKRFKEQTRHRLKAVKLEYDNFKVTIGENLETALARLSNIILLLTELNEPPTDEANRLTLTNAIQNGDDSLELLSALLAVQPATTDFAALKECVKNYQSHNAGTNAAANRQKRVMKSADNIESMDNIEVEICEHCGVRGHNVNTCTKRQADRAYHAQQNAKRQAGKGKKGGGRGNGGQFGARFGGRGGYGKGGRKGSKGSKGHGDEKGDVKIEAGIYGPGDEDDWTQNTEFAGVCWNCGEKGHRANVCNQETQQKKAKWNTSIDMITRRYIISSKLVNAKQEVNFIEDSEERYTDRMYFDSCCSHGMVVVRPQVARHMTNLQLRTWGDVDEIQLSEGGKTMVVTHTGDLGAFTNVFVCAHIRKNLCGLLRINDMGYGYVSEPSADGPKVWIYDADSGIKVLDVDMDPVIGLPYCRITDFLKLTPRHLTGMQSMDMMEGTTVEPDGKVSAVTTPMLPSIQSQEEYDHTVGIHKQALFQGKWHSDCQRQDSDEDVIDHGGYTASRGEYFTTEDGVERYHTKQQLDVAKDRMAAAAARRAQFAAADVDHIEPEDQNGNL
jgi:hypothetical protein